VTVPTAFYDTTAFPCHSLDRTRHGCSHAAYIAHLYLLPSRRPVCRRSTARQHSCRATPRFLCCLSPVVPSLFACSATRYAPTRSAIFWVWTLFLYGRLRTHDDNNRDGNRIPALWTSPYTVVRTGDIWHGLKPIASRDRRGLATEEPGPLRVTAHLHGARTGNAPSHPLAVLLFPFLLTHYSHHPSSLLGFFFFDAQNGRSAFLISPTCRLTHPIPLTAKLSIYTTAVLAVYGMDRTGHRIPLPNILQYLQRFFTRQRHLVTHTTT